MRRLIPATVLLLLIGLLVWAFLPRPVEVEVAQVAPRNLEVAVEEEGVAGASARSSPSRRPLPASCSGSACMQATA